jgi:hypothetical protein
MLMRKNLELGTRLEYFIFTPKHINVLKGTSLGFEADRHSDSVSMLVICKTALISSSKAEVRWEDDPIA